MSANDSGDRLWHARAIEGLLVCMTVQAWQGNEFAVPELFDPSKAYAASQASQTGRPSSITARISAIAQRADVSKLKPFDRWFQLAPFVANLALELYQSAKSRDIPQVIITESQMRLINMLIFCQASKGVQEHLDPFIRDQRLPPAPTSPKVARGPDESLANMLVDLTASVETSSSVVDVVEILSAAISSLASLGSTRKHGFLLRSLLLKLAPAMIKARKLGASEAGIHPAAALSATTSSSAVRESGAAGGIQHLLEAAAAASGISITASSGSGSIDISTRLAAKLQAWVDQHLSGDFALKLEIVQLCISVCDALPDMQASLTFTSELLKLAVRSPSMAATSKQLKTLAITRRSDALH